MSRIVAIITAAEDKGLVARFEQTDEHRLEVTVTAPVDSPHHLIELVWHVTPNDD